MKVKRTVWFSLRSSLWLVPGLFVLAGAGSALLLVILDATWGTRLASRWPQILTTDPDGARQVLAVIATSMITVAGVSFSITIVSLSLASSQYSSRVLRNFMRDRLNQVVLGILVGVFTYCTVVLQAIRADQEPFVPQLAVWAGIFLSLAGIGGLVAFIHHTAVSIQASEIIAKVAEETVQALGTARQQPAQAAAQPPPAETEWQEVAAERSGYIQDIEVEELMRLADERDVVIHVRRAVGDFVVRGRPQFALTPPNPLAARELRRFHEQFGISTYRTIEQDPEFGVRQIVDIALKALSPSINDSTTAINCVDYLERILHEAARRPAPPEHLGQEGRLRLIMKQPGAARLLRVGLNEIRQNARNNVSVTLRLLKLIAELSEVAPDPAVQDELRHQTRLIAEATEQAIALPADREEIRRRTRRLLGH